MCCQGAPSSRSIPSRGSSRERPRAPALPEPGAAEDCAGVGGAWQLIARDGRRLDGKALASDREAHRPPLHIGIRRPLPGTSAGSAALSLTQRAEPPILVSA